jgi:CarboxypepD_reg-like domain/TonB-dependent Receptor Plug Domain
MQKVYFLALVLLSSFAAYSQGSIAGNVKDAKTGEAVIGANVIIQGTTQGSPTDIDGNFLINNVQEGTYSLQVSSITYKTHTIPNVLVETAKKISIDIALHEDVSELQEVVVQGTRQTDTDFDLLKSIKEAKVVVVGITSEQISKSLDRDAAQVLRRVPGITIRGDQFVQVRGLSERYNPVMLHNAYAPSVETDVRSFSFATLPSSQLDRILVFKSPAADLPGDFAGGVVKVFTKSIPEENSLVLDYSTQYRAGTTFSDYYSQQKNNGHITGFNNGFYDLPASFPTDVKAIQGTDVETAGKSLRNDWVAQKSTAIPDQRFTLTFNRKFKIGKIEVGNISAVNYSNAYSIFDVTRSDYTNGSSQANSGYADKQYNQQIRTGFLFNWAFKFNSNHLIEFKNLLNQSSNDQYVDRVGNLDQSIGEKNGGFDKIYRRIYSGQLVGTHDIFNKQTTIEWVAGYNNSNRDQPDYRRYVTQNNGQLQIALGVVPERLGRFFAKLDESTTTAGASIKHRLAIASDPLKNPELKAGIFYEDKSRTFTARNLGYIKTLSTDPGVINQSIDQIFNDQNINNANGIRLAENTKPSDSYRASNRLLAYYLMGSVPFSKFKLDAGVRIEDNLQKLNGSDLSGNPANSILPVTRILPSANLSYNFSEKMLLRAAYGETLNRPEFREIASFTFFDFNFNFVYQGTPGLKTAKIQNLDLRWEYYPSKNELISFGAFYKDFQDPIETVIDFQGSTKNVFFANATSAKAYGVELEIKKSLSGLTGSAFVNNLNVLFNATVIASTIKIPDALAAQRSSSERPLQGQAPYVINAGLFYASEPTGWSVNLLYNVVGKNIVFVGATNFPDVYLMPRNLVDLTFSKRISERFQIKGGISDILNQPISFLQDGNNDNSFDSDKDSVKDPIVQQYKPGQVFSLGFSYRF